MLKADLRILEKAIADTLRINRARVRDLLAAPGNDWRLRHMRERGIKGCRIVPDADYLMLVVWIPSAPDGSLVMTQTLSVEEGDLTAWRALPDDERAPPRDLPIHEVRREG